MMFKDMRLTHARVRNNQTPRIVAEWTEDTKLIKPQFRVIHTGVEYVVQTRNRNDQTWNVVHDMEMVNVVSAMLETILVHTTNQEEKIKEDPR